MKIVTGRFHEETDTFSAVLCTRDRFEIHKGPADFPAFLGKNNSVSGIYDAVVKENGGELIPSLYMEVGAAGIIADAVVNEFLTDILAVIDANAPIDGVFLDLHGASVMESDEDACGYIIETIRKHVGDKVVITMSSDLHGNLTERIFRNADIVSGYQTYPHEDFYSTGHRSAEQGIRLIKGEKIYQAVVRIPMIVPAEGYSSNSGTFKQIEDYGHSLVENGSIIDYSIWQMQPWMDLTCAGSTVAVSASDKQTAEKYAGELAQMVFAHRRDWEVKLYGIDEVIDIAEANTTPEPVILVDSADSPNAGASADSSFVLARLLERGCKLKTALAVRDQAAAEKAFEVGIGKTAEFSLGGRYEPRFQKPTVVTAYVKSLSDGEYQATTSGARTLQCGKTAVLRVGNIDIVVYSNFELSSDPMSYRGFGIEPALYRLVMVKSANQFKLKYSEFSHLFYLTDTPGSSSANLRAMPFTHLPRPFWPFDEIDSFDGKVFFAREG